VTVGADQRWSGRRVAVTGAAGFIGSRLTQRLVELGADVRALLHYRGDGGRGLLDALPADQLLAIEVTAGDLRDESWLRRSLAGVSDVFHLGALVGIPYSYLNPRDVIATNVGGTLNVLEAVRDLGVGRLVQTSTSEVYGSAQRIPMSEDHPLSAQSPYAASKIAADQLALSFHRAFDVPVSIARPFNTYGPGQSARAVIPAIIAQALAGDEVTLGVTSTTRDLVYVDDTVAGLLAIASSDAALGRAVNIATGIETSITQIVVAVGAIVGRDLTVREDERRRRPAASEVDRLVGDSRLLRESCGWVPATVLFDGLARTVEWVRANRERHEPDAYRV